MRGSPGAVGAALKATGVWLGSLLVVAALFSLITTPLTAANWSGLRVPSMLTSWTGLLVPFVAFAAGAVIGDWPRDLSRRALGAAGVALALATYGLVAYAHPIVDDLRWQSEHIDVSASRLFQPRTPGAIAELRALVEADPPAVYSRSVDTPLSHPPNPLTYQLHLPALLAAFAVVNVLLGFLANRLTGDLSPPRRRNALWAMGLFGGIAFFVAMVSGDAWVASSLDASGALGAWLALSVPLVEGAVLLVSARRRSARVDGRASAS